MRPIKGWQFDARALYRNGILLLLLVSIALIVHNIFGPHGYLAARHQQKELHSLQQQILQLQQENTKLNKENRSLKSDPAAIERKAREDLHLAKPGEKIYTLPDKPHADPPPPAGQQTSPQP
jgi:cell division protein FtsB